MPPRRAPTEAQSIKRGSKEALWAIKKLDAEPLLRVDIQWQVLSDIFNDRSFRFTAPVDQTSDSEPVYLNFDQLYLEAILSSMRTTQNLRTKLIENPVFAINFCKICLLINVGRINTTLAFYPSMKTALRTYHPVPSIQGDEVSKRDMQDAPRIKGMLKACYLDWEVDDQPTNLRDIAKKSASPALTRGPPTTIVTAIFHLFNEASWASETYMPNGFDLLDIFYPSEMPSRPRAAAFLSIIHHILEDRNFINDFDSPLPPPVTLPYPIELMRDPLPGSEPENVDTAEEIEYADEMRKVRLGIVKTVPAYQKREEELNLRQAKKEEKEKDAVDHGALEPIKKRRKVANKTGLSFAKASHELKVKDLNVDQLPENWENDDWLSGKPVSSSFPSAWMKVRRDLEQGQDPDYDSDEESAWQCDTLLRRSLITVLNPATGRRCPPKDCKEYEEWLRRKEHGDILEPEDDIQYAGDELEIERANDSGGDLED